MRIGEHGNIMWVDKQETRVSRDGIRPRRLRLRRCPGSPFRYAGCGYATQVPAHPHSDSLRCNSTTTGMFSQCEALDIALGEAILPISSTLVIAACVPQAWQSAVVPKPTHYESGLLSPPLRRSPAPLTSA